MVRYHALKLTIFKLHILFYFYFNSELKTVFKINLMFFVTL